MTFKEKWDLEYPDKPYKPGNLGPGCVLGNFPEIRGLGIFGRRCMTTKCEDCWNSEMPTYKIDEECEEKLANKTTPMWPKENPHILDSGELTTFGTGAARSDFNADGTRKGRCDLLPLRVLAKIWRAFDTSLQERGIDKARVFDHIADFQDTENAQHLVLALNSFTGYLDFPTAFIEVAVHYEEGAEKYGECNWQKGLPIKNYVSSMVRHYLKWLRGDTDEHHDRAFVWNVLCCIWECEFSPRAASKTEQDTPVMVLEHVTKARPDQVLYLCDRLACPECDNPECSYTEDVYHAINFESVESDGASEGRRFVERCNSQLLLKNSAPGVYEVFGQLCLKGADSALYDMATGCPINATGFTYGKSMSLVDMHLGVEGLILGTAPGGALFYHNDCVWLRTTMTNTDDGSVYAVRLCDGKPERISGNTLVTSVEGFDFK